MIRSANPDDISALTDLYVQAFADNPAYGSIFSGLKYQHAALRWLFERRTRCLMACGCPWYIIVGPPEAASEPPPGTPIKTTAADAAAAPEGPAPAANSSPAPSIQVLAAVGMIPFSRKPSLWTMLKFGLWQWTFLWGRASLWRALKLGDACADIAASRPDLNIKGEMSMMAVAPAHQGQGLGSRLLQHCLREWDVRGGEPGGGGAPGGALTLGTQRAINVTFYCKHGFEVLEERDDGGYTSWHMYRSAAAGVAQ